MKLGNLKPARGSVKTRKRVGRGPGSGHGGTSTRGHKGEKARSGYTRRPWMEGGQMPLKRRLPKRGFTNVHALPAEAVNVRDLDRVGEERITAEVLHRHGLIDDPTSRLKVLGQGAITGKKTVRAHGFSDAARQKIEAAGGTVEVIVVPRRPKRYRKKVRK
jgi:large subunit ribosomal protein L15